MRFWYNFQIPFFGTLEIVLEQLRALVRVNDDIFLVLQLCLVGLLIRCGGRCDLEEFCPSWGHSVVTGLQVIGFSFHFCRFRCYVPRIAFKYFQIQAPSVNAKLFPKGFFSWCFWLIVGSSFPFSHFHFCVVWIAIWPPFQLSSFRLQSSPTVGSKIFKLLFMNEILVGHTSLGDNPADLATKPIPGGVKREHLVSKLLYDICDHE